MKNQRNKTKRKLKGGVDPPTEFSIDKLIEIWERSTVEMLRLYYEIDHQYDVMKNSGAISTKRGIDLNNACEIINPPVPVVPAEEDDVSETAEVPETKNDLGIPRGNYYYKYNTVSELQEFCGNKKEHLKDEKNRALRILFTDISTKSNHLLLINTNNLINIIYKKQKNPLYELTKEEFEYVNKINNRFKTDYSTMLGEEKFNEIKRVVGEKKEQLLKREILKVKLWISWYSSQNQKNAAAYIRSFFAPEIVPLRLGGNKRSRKSKQSRKHIRKLRKSNK